MVILQTQFNKFHETIRLDFDSSAMLREKRDIIVNNLRDGLKRFDSTKWLTFKSFNQGSYDLATGVMPLVGEDYDIDVGIIFNFSKSTYKPVQAKQWVYDALNTGARTVEIKRPCVRVQYNKDGKKWFHVDLAIYSTERDIWGSEVNYIAKGYVNSSDDKKIWESSEPFKLKELLKNKFQDNSDRDQFRRTIRYLKRWKDINFYNAGSGKPTGIAITACCYERFSPVKERNYYTSSYVYNDLMALRNVIDGIISMFTWYDTISVKLPVEPYNNLFDKMTNAQMKTFKSGLNNLREKLNYAISVNNTISACSEMRRVFGQDFPES